MRGTTSRQATMLSTLTTDSLIPVDHPIRRIKPVVEAELTELAPEFDAMYARTGRQSVPPEHLLKATVLMALYSIRSGHRHPHDGRSTGEQRVLQAPFPPMRRRHRLAFSLPEHGASSLCIHFRRSSRPPSTVAAGALHHIAEATEQMRARVSAACLRYRLSCSNQ